MGFGRQFVFSARVALVVALLSGVALCRSLSAIDEVEGREVAASVAVLDAATQTCPTWGHVRLGGHAGRICGLVSSQHAADHAPCFDNDLANHPSAGADLVRLCRSNR